jgi:mRNA interferase YafQ
MRKIERTTRFKRDYKREARGRHRAALDESLTALLRLLIADSPLSARHRDHPLGGEWAGAARKGRFSRRLNDHDRELLLVR